MSVNFENFNTACKDFINKDNKIMGFPSMVQAVDARYALKRILTTGDLDAKIVAQTALDSLYGESWKDAADEEVLAYLKRKITGFSEKSGPATASSKETEVVKAAVQKAYHAFYRVFAFNKPLYDQHVAARVNYKAETDRLFTALSSEGTPRDKLLSSVKEQVRENLSGTSVRLKTATYALYKAGYVFNNWLKANPTA